MSLSCPITPDGALVEVWVTVPLSRQKVSVHRPRETDV